MEYMGIWEAQHLGLIQSAEYVVGWVGITILAALLLYKAKSNISAIKKRFWSSND